MTGLRVPGSILFCCTNNALRSPMAEGLMKLRFGQVSFVQSVGVRCGELDMFMVAVMDEIGVDLSGHKPKEFNDLEDVSFDLIVSLSPEAQHQAVELTRTTAAELQFWNTFDPSMIEGNREMRLDGYRQVRDGLDARIVTAFGEQSGPVV